MMQDSSPVPPPPPVPPVAEPAPPRFRASDAWGPAAIQGLIAAVILLVAAEIVAFILYAVSGSSRPSVLMHVADRVVIFTLFHHIGMVFDAPNVTVSEPALGALLPPGTGFSLTVAAALMGGTLAVGAVLYRAGRIVGRAVPGPAWARGLHGAKIAITYTVVAALAGLAIHFTVHFPASPLVSGSFSDPSVDDRVDHLAARARDRVRVRGRVPGGPPAGRARDHEPGPSRRLRRVAHAARRTRALVRRLAGARSGEARCPPDRLQHPDLERE